MKVCVIADIHGNYDALKECIREAKKQNIKKFLCLGDYVGYYYEPDKCIDLLIDINAICIRGNHEDILFDILKNKQKLQYYKSRYGNGIKIALKKLKRKHLNFLKKLPKTKKIIINKKKVILSHGSPWKINEYIYPNKFYKFKERLNMYKHDTILVGHTHIQMKKKINSKIILNPGSVGQPRDGEGLAKWLIIDFSKMKHEFKKTFFNKKRITKQVLFYDKNKKNLLKYFQK
jgi:putative phosphoesterase